MDSLEDELARARDLPVDDLADAIESIGFECTRCGACCKGHVPGEEESDDSGEVEPHTATVFPDEVRGLLGGADGDGGSSDAPDPDTLEWRDVARPVPYGLHEGEDGPEGETFEWALQTDDCGNCTFYDEGEGANAGTCTAYGDRPLICRTYPFSVVLASEASEGSSEHRSDGVLGGTSQPMGEAVDQEGMVRAHECEGLGRDISRGEAEELARTLKERAVRELEEAIAVRDNYEPVDPGPGEVVVHDSEGAKRSDGSPL